jgi:hypothetical protein
MDGVADKGAPDTVVEAVKPLTVLLLGIVELIVGAVAMDKGH